MGCDIHFYAEKKVNGVWQSADQWEEDECDKERQRVPYEKQLYSDRNYNLFAILADVRNGRGFAGVDTGDGFVPIDDPRGLPPDVSSPVQAEADRWEGDGHSHSWFTVAELLGYDWTQTTKLRGWVDAATFWKWNGWARKHGEAPDSYSGGVYGGSIKHVSLSEMEAIATEATRIRKDDGYSAAEEWLTQNHGSTYTQAEWMQPYFKCARGFLSETIPQLLRLGKPEDVRIVFWFDN